MDSDLGAKVKKLRISQGLTQEDVAKALDVTPGYISNVENGRNLMTLRMSKAIQVSTCHSPLPEAFTTRRMVLITVLQMLISA